MTDINGLIIGRLINPKDFLICYNIVLFMILFLLYSLQILQAERDDQMFPDEVDTPLDVPARVRFAK